MKYKPAPIIIRNDVWTEGAFIALCKPNGDGKVSRAVIEVDKLLPQLTPDELEKVLLEIELLELRPLLDPNCDPKTRQQTLEHMEVCPVCQRWLGHNNPPADDTDHSDDDLSWLTKPVRG